MPAEATLPGLLRRAADAHPDAVAVRVDGGDRLTYGAWEGRSDNLAGGLHAQGVLPGDRVVLVFDAARWCDYAITYLAVHKAGAVPVLLTAGTGDVALRRGLRDHQPAAVVAPGGLVALDDVAVLDPASLESGGRGRPPLPPAPTAHPAEILADVRPLSGPRPLERALEDLVAPWAGAEPVHSTLLHSFAPGSLAGQEAMVTSLSAATASVVLAAFHPVRLCELLAGQPVSACALHPATAQALLVSGATYRHDLSGVERVVLASGSAAPASLIGLASAFPHATLVSVVGHARAAREPVVHDRRRPGAVGLPGGATTVWVAGGDGRPAPTGTVGRVRVGTGEADPAGDATDGTLGFIDTDGFLYVVTGRHEVVRRRGAPVSKAEVETALAEHPAVVDCAALGIPDDRAATTLLAAVEIASPVTAQDLRTWVGARIGEDRVPEDVAIVAELPRNAAGVLLAGALRRRLGLAEPAGAPRGDPTPAQKAVIATWRRVLGARDVELDDDFFELGGTQLAAAGVLDLLEDAVGLRLPLGAFLESPTVTGLAGELERAAGPAATTAPVAFSQEGMVWHEVFAPGCQNLPGLARRYRGRLDIEALERALEEIVRRHEPLRTIFELRGGRLLQAARPHRRVPLAVRDLGDLPPDERDEEVARRVAEAGQRPFDLTRDPVFAAGLLRLADDDHVLVIRTHHSVFDDWSVGVFRRELATLYTRFTGGDAPALPEPPRFTDFARSQRRTLAGPAGTREMAFWRRELAGAPLTAQLPVDDPARPVGSSQAAGQPVSLTLPRDLHRGLRDLARDQRATVFMTMLAAYAVLVHRYTGQDDLLVATVVANRNRTDLEGMIGCFTKKVPLRLRTHGDPPFVEMLARTRTALLGALTHQDLPFEAVIQEVLGAPAAAHGLVPHVVLMFQGETPRRELHLPGLDTTGFETATTARRAHFMADDEQPHPEPHAVPWGSGLYRGTFVILSVAESDDELSCVARGAFHGPAVRGLLDAYRTVLADVVAGPTRPVSQLALLDAAGQAEAVARGRGGAPSVPASTLDEAFAARVRHDPDTAAIHAGGTTLTTAELDVRADRLAARLQALGVAPGATVGLALEASPDAVVAAFAVWKAGAAWVGLDPEDAAERLAGILTQTSTQVVIGTDPRGTITPHAQLVTVDGGRHAPDPAPAPVEPEACAVTYFGAGAETVAQGVVLDHRGLLALAAGLRDLHAQPDPAPRRVCLSASPTGGGFVRQLGALLNGHTLCVPERSLAADPAATLTLLQDGHADVLDCTPAQLATLLDAGLEEVLTRRASDAPEPLVVLGTDRAVDPETWAALRGLAGARTAVLYGPAACAFGATAGFVARSPRAVAGRPLTGVQAHVLDERGRPVPAHAVGELHVAGLGLATGYLDGSRDDLRQQSRGGQAAFVRHALDGEATRLCRTGQRARRLPDGTVELLGIVDADTDLRGFAVDVARIQAVLAGCPGVRDITVTLHRDGRDGPRLVAHLTPDGQPPSLAELRRHLWARLPGYAWPSAVVVVGDAAAPGTAEDGNPPRGAAGNGHPPSATGEDGAEAAVLRQLWADMLGATGVGAGENYWQRFSFLEVLARAREVGLAVAAEHVTRNRTVGTLAADVAADRQVGSHPA